MTRTMAGTVDIREWFDAETSEMVTEIRTVDGWREFSREYVVQCPYVYIDLARSQDGGKTGGQ